MTDNRIDRRQAVAQLLRDRGDLLVIAGLGGTAWDTTAAGDNDLTFPLWGGMGNAAMIGLGLALARPERRVLVVTGDGEMLMGLGGLATIAVRQPENLAVVLCNNGLYGETGRQKTHVAAGVDLVAMARGAGIHDSRFITDMAGVDSLRDAVHNAPGPLFADMLVSQDLAPMVLPPRDGVWLKHRFRRALLGDDGG